MVKDYKPEKLYTMRVWNTIFDEKGKKVVLSGIITTVIVKVKSSEAYLYF